MPEQTFYTYVYRDPLTQIPFLVGKGTKKRAWDHLKRKDKHPATYKIQKLLREGHLPLIEIIPAINEEHAFFLEECLISVIGRKDLGLGPLYNLTDGGDGIRNISPSSKEARYSKTRGQKRSAETCKRISEARKGCQYIPQSKESIAAGAAKRVGQKRTKDTRENISRALKGKTKGVPKPPFSEKHKQSIREARLGKKHSEEAKANMRKPKDMTKNKRPCTIDGTTIYPSVGAMAAVLGTGRTGTRSPNFRYV